MRAMSCKGKSSAQILPPLMLLNIQVTCGIVSSQTLMSTVPSPSFQALTTSFKFPYWKRIVQRLSVFKRLYVLAVERAKAL
jgi:hypothetical protein